LSCHSSRSLRPLVINKLEETNEESLISDTMIINTAAKTYIKYSSDKDEIPATK
jgi:hypothetical protein